MGIADKLREEEEAENDSTPSMPFGRYKGQKLKTIPANYLLWLLAKADLNEPLLSQVREEIKSRDIDPDKETKKKRYGDSSSYKDKYENWRERMWEDLTGRVSSQEQKEVSNLEEIVSRWFRRLSLRYHPDRGGSDAEMRVINTAREELMEILRNEGII